MEPRVRRLWDERPERRRVRRTSEVRRVLLVSARVVEHRAGCVRCRPAFTCVCDEGRALEREARTLQVSSGTHVAVG